MKSTLKFLAASAMLTLTGSLVLTGCPSDDCTLNSDCDTGYICDADSNSCVLEGASCTANADCTTDGEFCIAAADNSGNFLCGVPTTCADIAVEGERDGYCDGGTAGTLCLPAASGDADVVECRAPANCGEAADVNVFCRAENGETGEEAYTCDVTTDAANPTCVADVVAEHYYVAIQDVTTADCDLTVDDNGFDSGSDITFVELQAADGTALGYGKTASYKQGSGMNDFTTQEVLDGSAPDLLMAGGEMVTQEDLDNRCPAGDSAGRFSKTSVLTLGCGGSVIVDFPKDSDKLPIYNGQKVVVGEYASVCNQSEGGNTTGTDKYEVYVCPAAPAGNDVPTDISCMIKISASDVGGLKTSTVAGAKDAPASN